MVADDLFAALLRIRRTPRELPALVLSLALGAGTTCAACAILSSVLGQSLPYRDPESLVSIVEQTEAASASPSQGLSLASFELLRRIDAPFEAVSAYAPTECLLSAQPHGASRRVRGLLVSAEFFDVLGVRPLEGRAFQRGDQASSSLPPVIVSDRLRRGPLAGTQLGQTVYLDGLPHVIVGVVPATFWFPDVGTDFWVTLTPRFLSALDPRAASVPGPREPRAHGVTSVYVFAIGRLRHGTSKEAAHSMVNSVLLSTRRGAALLRPYADEVFGHLRPLLLLAQVAALFVLALACTNAAWIFQARAERHRSQVVVMTTLGATPLRIVAQHLFETLAIAAMAVLPALLVAWLLLRVMRLYSVSVVVPAWSFALTAPVIALTAGVVTAAALVCSLPSQALVWCIAARADTAPTRVVSSGRRRTRRVLVALQLGTGLALAMQAVFVVMTLSSLVGSNLGFRSKGLTVAQVSYPGERALEPSVQATRYSQLVGALAARGIRAAVTTALPLSGYDRSMILRLDPRTRTSWQVGLRLVTPGYFSICGLQLQTGRLFDRSDTGARVMIVNDVLAARFFGSDAVGKRAVVGAVWDPPAEIVGVTRGVRHRGLLDTREPEIYMPLANVSHLSASTGAEFVRSPFVVADLGPEPELRRREVQAALAEHFPDARVSELTSLDDIVWAAAGERPIVTAGVTVFAITALLLLGAGVYGLASQEVQARKQQIAIRLALGATPRRIVWSALAVGSAAYVLGIAVALVATVWLRSAIMSSVFVPPDAEGPDIWMIGGIAMLFVGLVLIAACYGPTKRLIAIDPAVTLRAQ